MCPVHSTWVPYTGRDMGHDDGMRCQLPQRLRETTTLRFHSTEIAHSAMASMTRLGDLDVAPTTARRLCLFIENTSASMRVPSVPAS